MGDHIRAFSISQFDKFHRTSSESEKSIDTLFQLSRNYRFDTHVIADLLHLQVNSHGEQSWRTRELFSCTNLD